MIWNVDYFDRSAVAVTFVFLYELIKNTKNYSTFIHIVANAVKTPRRNNSTPLYYLAKIKSYFRLAGTFQTVDSLDVVI